MGDPARANMLCALMDGRSLTATELGLHAGVAPSTASGHLAKLVAGRLIVVSSSGRHRYFRLASPAVARALETLMALSADGPPRHRPKARCDEAMARARTCYDHLAGKLGVALADKMVERELIIFGEDDALVTKSGRTFFDNFGVSMDVPKGSRRSLCRPCMDWTERRLHLGGVLGASIASRCFELGWIERRKHDRALTVTAQGIRGFEKLFSVRL